MVKCFWDLHLNKCFCGRQSKQQVIICEMQTDPRDEDDSCFSELGWLW